MTELATEVQTLARVDEVWLGFEDHGIFSVHIGWDYGTSHHGTGHIALGDKGIEFLKALCNVFGVQEFAKIKGRTIYVLRDSDGWNARPIGFRSLAFDGTREFYFSEVFGDD